MRIIAIDPGLERTGYAVVEQKKRDFSIITYDCFFTSKKNRLIDRIAQLAIAINQLLAKYKPEKIVCEQLFFNTNLKTAVAIAQVQGAIMVEASRNQVEIEFMTPLQVKQAVTGYGRADKKAVEKMVVMELGLTKAPFPDDIVDALAIAIAYCSRLKLPANWLWLEN